MIIDEKKEFWEIKVELQSKLEIWRLETGEEKSVY